MIRIRLQKVQIHIYLNLKLQPVYIDWLDLQVDIFETYLTLEKLPNLKSIKSG